MTGSPILSLEFDRAIASINANIDALRGEMGQIREDLGTRMDRLEIRHDEATDKKLADAKEEGKILGRVEAIEGRLNRSESWRLATIGSGIAGITAILFELLRK
jgi:hypothetical protein